MREKDNRIGYVSLFIIVIVGLNLNFSIQAHDKERRDFCISKGFSGYDHDFIPQIYFCYKQNGEKIYMASYAGNYSLFDPAKSCDTLQFKVRYASSFSIQKCLAKYLDLNLTNNAFKPRSGKNA